MRRTSLPIRGFIFDVRSFSFICLILRSKPVAAGRETWLYASYENEETLVASRRKCTLCRRSTTNCALNEIHAKMLYDGGRDRPTIIELLILLGLIGKARSMRVEIGDLSVTWHGIGNSSDKSFAWNASLALEIGKNRAAFPWRFARFRGACSVTKARSRRIRASVVYTRLVVNNIARDRRPVPD